MVRIVLKRPFCLGFARIFGKMQDEMQDKREPARPHGNWAGAELPVGCARKMQDLNPFLSSKKHTYSVLYNLQLFSGDGSFTQSVHKKENTTMANTTQKRPTELGKEIAATLAACPDPMSRTDFRKACHIGTRTSIYLLQSGLVPCENTGKRTRCYKIAKADVAAYLRRRLTEPEYYAPPSGWYKNYPQRKPPAVSLTRTLDYEIVSRLLLRRHLEQQLADAPDVLTVEQIARFTGYTPHTVSRWCTEGRLRTIQRRPRFMVPKTWLLDYLVSDDYNRITRKSGKHYGMIREVAGAKK